MRGLTKAYPGGIVALRDLTLEVAPGELVAVVGPSGCGKSTLLRLVAGIEGADEGEIRIEDRVADALSPRERDVALVFQTHSLFPHLTAFDNMAYGLRLRGTPAQEIAARVGEAAGSLGIKALLTRRPAQLSGGERQRVALGRALVRRARLLLLDEPLSSLDAHLRADLRQVILRVHRLLGGVTLLVTHDQAEAMGLADRVAVLKEGTLQQIGSSAELYERPTNRFVAGFIGVPAASFFEGDVVSRGAEIVFESPQLSFALEKGSLAALAEHRGKGLVAGIRPEHWQWFPVEASERGPARGRVEWIEGAGSRAFAHVRIADTSVVALCPQPVPALGDDVRLGPDPRRVLLFDRSGGRIR
jgi:multiple sugar transport system ATP-binding protein